MIFPLQAQDRLRQQFLHLAANRLCSPAGKQAKYFVSQVEIDGIVVDTDIAAGGCVNMLPETVS